MNYEEWARLMKEQQANNQFSLNPPNVPYSPNGGQMISQSAGPDIAGLSAKSQYNPASQQAVMASLMRGGQEGLATGPAEGKQIGDIYVGPTWGDILANTGKQLVGGYQMREARNMADDIADNEKAAAAATGELAKISYDEEQAQRASDEELEDRKLKQALRIAQMNEKGRNARRASSDSSRSPSNPENYKRWENPEGESLYTYNRGGKTFDMDTNEPLEDGWISEGNWEHRSAVTGNSAQSAVAKLVKDTEHVRDLSVKYTDLESAFKDSGFDLAKGENPLNWIEKAEGNVGLLARALADSANGEGPTKGILFSRVSDVLGSLIRAQAGLAQTKIEIDRLNYIYGKRWLDDPEIMADALKRLGPRVQADITDRVSSIDPSVLEAYRGRLKESGAKDWTQWAPQEAEEEGEWQDLGNGIRVRIKPGG